MNGKAVYKMLIAVELFVSPTLKKQPKKHIVFLFKMIGIGYHKFTERSMDEDEGE